MTDLTEVGKIDFSNLDECEMALLSKFKWEIVIQPSFKKV